MREVDNTSIVTGKCRVYALDTIYVVKDDGVEKVLCADCAEQWHDDTGEWTEEYYRADAEPFIRSHENLVLQRSGYQGHLMVCSSCTKIACKIRFEESAVCEGCGSKNMSLQQSGTFCDELEFSVNVDGTIRVRDDLPPISQGREVTETILVCNACGVVDWSPKIVDDDNEL